MISAMYAAIVPIIVSVLTIVATIVGLERNHRRQSIRPPYGNK